MYKNYSFYMNYERKYILETLQSKFIPVFNQTMYKGSN